MRRCLNAARVRTLPLGTDARHRRGLFACPFLKAHRRFPIICLGISDFKQTWGSTICIRAPPRTFHRRGLALMAEGAGRSVGAEPRLASPAPRAGRKDASMEAPDLAEDSMLPEPEEVEWPGVDALGWSDPPDAVQGKGKEGRRYHGRTFHCISVSGWPRRGCIELVESSYFEPFILTVIICNVITMAWTSPLDPQGTTKAAFISVRTAWSRAGPTLPPWSVAAMRRLPPTTLALTNALPPLLCVIPPTLGVHPFPADVRGHLPGHLHIRDDGQNHRVRLCGGRRRLPEGRVVPARLCGGDIGMAAHSHPGLWKLFRCAAHLAQPARERMRAACTENAQAAPRTRSLHRERAGCTENAQHREPTRTGETRRERWDHQPIFALTLPSSPCLPAVLALARVSLLQSSERFGRCGRCER